MGALLFGLIEVLVNDSSAYFLESVFAAIFREDGEVKVLLNSPLLPPRFSMSMISDIVISLSTALHMS